MKMFAVLVAVNFAIGIAYVTFKYESIITEMYPLSRSFIKKTPGMSTTTETSESAGENEGLLLYFYSFDYSVCVTDSSPQWCKRHLEVGASKLYVLRCSTLAACQCGRLIMNNIKFEAC